MGPLEAAVGVADAAPWIRPPEGGYERHRFIDRGGYALAFIPRTRPPFSFWSHAQVDRAGIVRRASCITNSKDLRKLRSILPDPVARENFLSEEGDLETAMLRLGDAPQKDKGGIASDLDTVVNSM